MSSDMTLQLLSDRAAISDVVIRFATALDQRDWRLYRSLFTDPFTLDYSSFDPELRGEWKVDDWIEFSRSLGTFDSTRHISSNHVHDIDGNEARCISYMQAAHFLKREGEQFHCILHGYYTNLLRRTSFGWKIHSCTLNITATQGDPRVFEWVNLRDS